MQDKEAKEVLGSRLRKYRLEREWSLTRLSQVTRIAASALWYMEQGKRKPSDVSLYKIKKALPGLIEEIA